jgi:hypothetical protein
MKNQWSGPAVVAAIIIIIVHWVATVLRTGAWPASYPPRFDDMRLMLEGLDCARRGIDPHLEPDCDWRKRPFNYPSVWLSLSHLGLTAEDTDAVGAMPSGRVASPSTASTESSAPA